MDQVKRGNRLVTSRPNSSQTDALRVPEAQGLRHATWPPPARTSLVWTPSGPCSGSRGSELAGVRFSCQPDDARPDRLAFRGCDGEASFMAAGHGARPVSNL